MLLSSFKTLKKNQGDMRLENVGPNFKEVLEATGLDVTGKIGRELVKSLGVDN